MDRPAPGFASTDEYPQETAASPPVYPPPPGAFPAEAASYPPPSPFRQGIVGKPLPASVQAPAVIGHPWTTGLFDCCDDPANAVMTAFLPCVTYGQVGEILDAGQTSCVVGSFLYLLMMPGLCACVLLGSAHRRSLRLRYNLVEAPAEDLILHLFCTTCALCQEFRELKNKGIDPSMGYWNYLAQQQNRAATYTDPPQSQYMR